MYKPILSLILFTFLISCHQDDTVIPPSQNGNNFWENEELDVDINDQSQCNYSIPLYDELTGQELEDYLKFCFRPSTSFTYTEARTLLYSEIDVINGKVQCIYSGYEVALNPAPGQSYINAAAVEGINTEHSFPQSLGADAEPARSDMFHLYPALAYVNEARSNKYFAESPDNQTVNWYYLDQTSSSIPSSNIDAWSEDGGITWEPREAIKGDIARGIFYFKLIYDNTADQAFFNQMRNTLIEWHKNDPVDQKEMNRNNRIKQHQGNDNPFILDASLAERLF